MEELIVTGEDLNILQLPEEVLEEIVSYVDIKSRRNLGPVCKDLYKILCRLERDKHPLEITFSQIYEDDETYESIINSRREICDLTINVKGCGILPQSNRLAKLVRKFGLRLIKFKIWCSVQGESAEICDEQLMTILNCVPNIEELVLRNVFVSSSYMQQEELNLFKLKRLVIDYCLFDTPVVLNSLPAEILNELVFTFESNDETRFQNFFNRQKNIKKLELFENDLIAFDHLELEHLKISSGIDFSVMVGQQPNLKYLDFAITWIDDDVFTSVTKLAHLEVLRTLIDQVSVHTFRSLANLSKLKELRLDSHSPHDCGHLLELSMMRCDELEKLTLLYTERMIPPEILIQMSLNFRRLKAFEIINRSINIVAVILEYFPRLESIVFDFFAIFGAPEDVLVVDANLRHENLKQIVVTNVSTREADNTRALLKLVSVCPNLEKIMLSELTELSIEDFRNIIENHQNLTHLSLEFDAFEFNNEVVQIITSSTNIVHLRLNGLTVFPRYLGLQAIFEEIFPNITIYEYSNNHGQIVMKSGTLTTGTKISSSWIIFSSSEFIFHTKRK